MDGLPNEVLGEIMLFLNPTEIFTIYARIDKFVHTVTKSDYYVKRYLSNYLHISKDINISYEKLIDILKKIKLQKAMNIEFLGFGTTGGVDSNIPANWVASLFKPKMPGYCSRENKENIICAGVLAKTQEKSEGNLFEIRRKIARIMRAPYMIELLRQNYSEKSPELTYHELVLFTIFWDRDRNIFRDPDKSPESNLRTQTKISNIVRELIENTVNVNNYKVKENDDFTLIQPINYESANFGGHIAVIKSVSLSISKDFTCPVEAFLIFASEVYIDIQSDEFSKYDNLKNAFDIDSLISNDSKIPKSHPHVIGRNIEYRVFT